MPVGLALPLTVAVGGTLMVAGGLNGSTADAHSWRGAIRCTAPISRQAARGPVIGAVQFRGIRSAATPATKVLLVVRAATGGDLVLSGRRCADGRRLRFWYGNRPSLPDRVTPTTGSQTYLIEATGPEPGRPGYFLPSKAGDWQVVLTRRQMIVGSFVFCASSSSSSPAPCLRR
jgi:hypothetical protein